MKIWLIMSGEPLEQFGERPHRVGILSKMLVEKGHNVTWWTTDFDHQHKKYFYNKDKKVKNKFEVNMFFLHPKTPYYKNISLSRIKNHKEAANKFSILSAKEKKPDIIFCAFPTIELAYEAVKYGKQNDVPVIIDVRDMWPNIFVDLLPEKIRFLGKIVLKKYYNMTRYIFNNAFAITGMTEKFVEYGLEFSSRCKTKYDRDFSFGYEINKIDKKDNKDTLKLLKQKIDLTKFNIVFFGTIGKQFEFETIIEVANNVKDEDIQFIICGNGDRLEELKNNIKNKNIVFPGWLSQKEILELMKKSKVAIAPYKNSKDFLSSLPNKVIEYMAGKLPILSSIHGIVGNLITKNKCGFVYENKEDLEKYIFILKNDEILREKMSGNSFKLYQKKYNAKIVYAGLIEYLENIVKDYKYGK